LPALLLLVLLSQLLACRDVLLRPVLELLPVLKRDMVAPPSARTAGRLLT
jgi:hypothetical protein